MERMDIRTIAEALAGPNPLGCAVRENGELVIVDSSGKKQTFYPADYQHLLRRGKKTSPAKGGSHANA
mgnify:CR=1 FL=1|jgi:hypothetical protein